MKKLIALTGALLAGSALAAVSNNAAVSTTNVSSTDWEDFKERTHVSYFAEANKASAESESPDAYLYHSISGRYKLNDKMSLNIDLSFQTTDKDEDKYSELDPDIGIRGITYTNGNFSVFSAVEAEINMTDKTEAVDENKLFELSIYNAAAYSMNEHGISIGLELSRWFYEGGDEPGMNKKLALYSDVSYRYTIDDSATFQAFYEVSGANRPDKSSGDLARSSDRLLVGMDFTIAKGTTLYPHIDYRPADDTDIQDLGIGAWFSTQFF